MGLWTTAFVNNLPDSSFAYIEPGGQKDDSGKTEPRTKRHLPYKSADGKPDAAHVRDALSRLDQTQIPDAAKASAKSKLEAAAKELGIGQVSKTDDQDSDVHLYVAFEKRDDSQRMVWGYASTPELDSQGDRVETEAIRAALPAYMKFGNVREMHERRAVGKTKEATVTDDGLYIGVKVIDRDAWEKCQEGVLSGFSIGGRVTKRDPSDRSRVTGLILSEISLVDRPANPSAVFDVVKCFAKEEAMEKEALEKIEAGFARLEAALTKVVDVVAKGKKDPDPKPDDDKGEAKTASELELQRALEEANARLSKIETDGKLAKRKQILDLACAAGKFRANERKQWEKDYDTNPGMVERVLKSMAAVVPMGERVGVGADGDDDSADEKFQSLVDEKAKEIVAMDKCDYPTAWQRAVDQVFRKHPELWEARTNETLAKCSPRLVMGNGTGGLL